MADNYLCTIRRTIHPFHIESIGINIYSIEELCYYLTHYIYFIDESVINADLAKWIGEELGLERLAKIQMRVLEREEGALNFLLPVFRECSYLNQAQLEQFKRDLADIQIEPRDVRRKMKADQLLGFEMYGSAISEYEKILERRSPGRLGVQFYAQILECMASAYAGLFRFKEAADCLWISYQSLRSKKIYQKYLQILPLFLSEQQYEKRLEEIRVNLDTAQRLREDTQELLCEAAYSEYAQNIEEISDEEFLSQIKKNYLRNMAGVR